jgi:hypothetical protein
MIRFLRILCVSSIAVFCCFVLLATNQNIDVFTWILASKLTLSSLFISLVFLLLDNKRKSYIGKTTILFTSIAVVLLILSIQIIPLNTTWNYIVALLITSFILIIYSQSRLQNLAQKSIYYGALLIPVGIIFKVELSLFYVLSGVVLTIMSIHSVFTSLKKVD